MMMMMMMRMGVRVPAGLRMLLAEISIVGTVQMQRRTRRRRTTKCRGLRVAGGATRGGGG